MDRRPGPRRHRVRRRRGERRPGPGPAGRRHRHRHRDRHRRRHRRRGHDGRAPPAAAVAGPPEPGNGEDHPPEYRLVRLRGEPRRGRSHGLAVAAVRPVGRVVRAGPARRRPLPPARVAGRPAEFDAAAGVRADHVEYDRGRPQGRRPDGRPVGQRLPPGRDPARDRPPLEGRRRGDRRGRGRRLGAFRADPGERRRGRHRPPVRGGSSRPDARPARPLAVAGRVGCEAETERRSHGRGRLPAAVAGPGRRSSAGPRPSRPGSAGPGATRRSIRP